MGHVTKSYVVGLTLFGLTAVDLLLATVGWLAGMSISRFTFVVALVIVLGLQQYLLWQHESTYRTRCFMVTIGVVVGALLLAIGTYDRSYDGVEYHQAAIYSLAHGWNPVREFASPFVHGDNALWVSHYAKGMETLAATVVALTGLIESGKMMNMVLIMASFCFVLDALQCYIPGFSYRRQLLFASLLAFSYVVVCQVLTYTIDWALCSLLLILGSFCFRIYKGSRSIFDFIGIGLVAAMAFAIKFNIAFWVCLAAGIFGIAMLCRHRRDVFRRGVAAVAGGIVLGIVIFGYNPYITNVRSGHHILYPLIGEGAVDIMTHNTPLSLRDKNRVEAVVLSLFSRPDNAYLVNTEYINPYTKLTMGNFLDIASVDCRLGYFGFFWIEIFVLSIVVFLLAYRNDRHWRIVGMVLVALFVALFVLPSGWWGRYVGFFYFFPIIVLLYVEKYGMNRRWVGKLLLWLVVVNISITALESAAYAVRARWRTDKVLAVLQASQPARVHTECPGFRYKLEENGIATVDYVPTEAVSTLKKSSYYYGSPVYIDLPGLEARRGRDVYKNLLRKVKNIFKGDGKE